MSATTQQLSSGKFCKLRYNTIPVKSASANVSSYTSNSKMSNFELWHSCRKLANCYRYKTLCHILTKLSKTYMKTLSTSYTNTYDSTYFNILNCTNAVGYATMNKCYNKEFLSIEGRMLQRTWRNTTGWQSTRVHMTCRAFPLWLECQSSSLLSFVRFSYQFSSVITESLLIVFTK